jgi:hypothetical protein
MPSAAALGPGHAQELPQLALLVVERREGDVAGLRRQAAQLLAAPHQDRVPETGTGTDHGTRAARLRLTGLEHHEMAGVDLVDAIGGSDEIVDQAATRDPESLAERAAVESPGQVGDVGHLAPLARRDRPGDGDAGRLQAGGVGPFDEVV